MLVFHKLMIGHTKNSVPYYYAQRKLCAYVLPCLLFLSFNKYELEQRKESNMSYDNC